MMHCVAFSVYVASWRTTLISSFLRHVQRHTSLGRPAGGLVWCPPRCIGPNCRLCDVTPMLSHQSFTLTTQYVYLLRVNFGMQCSLHLQGVW
jgi:hypothetical protein